MLRNKTWFGLFIIMLLSSLVFFSFASTVVNVNTTSITSGGEIVASFPTVGDTNAWIGFYKVGSTDRQFISYTYLKNASGTYTVKAPLENGSYHFRLFGDNGYTKLEGTSQSVEVKSTTTSTTSNKGENAWVLVDVIDYPNNEGWETANASEVYDNKATYKQSNFTVKKSYIGSSQGTKVNGEGVKLSAIFTGPPEVINEGDEVSLTVNLQASENTLSFYTFSGSAKADFYPNVDIDPAMGSGTRFLDGDGNNNWTIGGTSYSPIQEIIKAKAPSGGNDGDQIVLRQNFYAGVSMATYYVYEWKAPEEGQTTPLPSVEVKPTSDGESGWVYEKTIYNNSSGQWVENQPVQLGGETADGYELARLSSGKLAIDTNRENRLKKYNSEKTTREIVRLDYTWTQPPSIISPDENFNVTINREFISFQHGDWYPRYWAQVKSGLLGTNLDDLSFKGPDGKEYNDMVWTDSSWGAQQSTTLEGVRYVSMDSLSGQWIGSLPAGKEGQQQVIELSIGHVAGSYYSEQHIYNWQEGTSASEANEREQPTPEVNAGSGEVFESGVRLEWPAASGLGYRVFRSKDRNSLGISITDFYITSTRVVDVNVEPNTEYYYTVKPVLAEANPLRGVEESLGDTLATFTFKTGGNIANVDQQKGFVVLQVDNAMMIVNGASQEIDPGRGTSPIIISGRSMVPIRAIVEALGGTVGWEGSERKIILNARGQQVEMWVDKNDIRKNGADDRMDVAPTIQDGRTFVPVRFASENLGTSVDWINSTREIIIVFTE
ncbi:MAG TPA: copper amine oxidase N-terminal domain-containing protein [Clostridia bacterium]|nr:copper amine oxidase N-terminal domain-containing protein [Clostridia bacterium]